MTERLGEKTMVDRWASVLFKRELRCDFCPTLGAWDFYGDYMCDSCWENVFTPSYHPRNIECRAVEVYPPNAAACAGITKSIGNDAGEPSSQSLAGGRSTSVVGSGTVLSERRKPEAKAVRLRALPHAPPPPTRSAENDT